MPRPGVSYLDVAKTATKLFEQNIHPTIEEVRKVLRTGSNSTINRHLREWRAKQGNQIEAEKGLPETLLISVKGIYDSIQEEASIKALAIENESRIKISELEIKINQLTHSYNLSQQSNEALKNEINSFHMKDVESQNVINNLNRHADKNIIDIQSLKDRLDDRASEIERISQQLKHAQNNIEHYRESIKQERDKEKERYESRIRELEQQSQKHQNDLYQAKNKISALAQELESLGNAVKKLEVNLNQSSKDCHQKELLAQEYKINFFTLKKEHDKIIQQNQLLIDQSKSDTNTISNMTKNIERLLERSSILESNLKKAENKVDTLNAKNLFLAQEKIELASQLKMFDRQDA